MSATSSPARDTIWYRHEPEAMRVYMQRMWYGMLVGVACVVTVSLMGSGYLLYSVIMLDTSVPLSVVPAVSFNKSHLDQALSTLRERRDLYEKRVRAVEELSDPSYSAARGKKPGAQ